MNKQTKTNEQFLEEVREIHGDKYDLSKVNYTGAYSKVSVICNVHGEFLKTARDLLKGGCKKCGVIRRAIKRKKTPGQFFEDVLKKHGNKYDYTNTIFKGFDEDINVNCIEHGEFTINPRYHLDGTGCDLCLKKDEEERLSKRRKSYEKKFVEKSTKLHKGKYSYKKTSYNGSNKKLIVTCPEHGDFECFAGNHLKGHGCAKCAGFGKTTEEFIAESIEVHGNKYDYSRSDFKGVDQYITIICPIHGPFEQRALGHLNGKGCKECQRDNWRLSLEDFISKANKKHFNKYDYSQTIYGNDNKEILTIICPKHGEFFQSAKSHLSGHGCRECNFEKQTKSSEDFFKQVKIVHDNRYDYSKAQYRRSTDKIDIICPSHGIFEQGAGDHLRGSGCPKCSNTGQYSIKRLLRGDFDDDSSTLVYVYVAKQIRAEEDVFINIGIARDGYHSRYHSSHPYKTEEEADKVLLPKTLAILLEQSLLSSTYDFHHKPNISFAGGAKECRKIESLPIIEEIIENFISNPSNYLKTKIFLSEAKSLGLDHKLESLEKKINQLRDKIII